MIIHSQQDQLTLNVGVVKSFPPHYSLSDSGKPEGFAIDTFEYIADNANFTINYIVKESWSDLFLALESGEVDLIPNQGITDLRLQTYSFSDPVETFPIHMFTRTSFEDLASIQSLNNKKVAVVKKNVGEVLIKQATQAEVKVFTTFDQALFELLSGNSDALIAPEPVILSIVRQIKVVDRIKINGPVLSEIKRAVSVLNGNEWIIDRINPVIKEFLLTDDYINIYTKWYGEPVPFWNIRLVFIAMSISTVIIIFIVLIWKNNSTDVKVKNRTKELNFKGYLLDNVTEGVITINLDKKITSWNLGAESLFGYKEKQVLGTKFESLIENNSESIDDKLKETNKFKSTEIDIKYKYKLIDEFEGLTTITALLDESKKHIGYIVTIQDITERKGSELRLKENESKLRSYIDNAPDGVFVLNSYGVFRDVNTAVENITGFSSPELLNMSLFDLFLEEDLENGVKHLKIVVELGKANEEFEVINKDGSKHWCSVSIVKLSTTRFLGFLKDITERKLADIALSTEKENLSVTLRSIADGVITTDTNGNIVMLNKVAEDLTGWSSKEAEGNPLLVIFNIMQGHTLNDFINPVDEILDNGDIVDFEKYNLLIAKDGSEFHIAGRGTPIRDNNGSIVGVVIVFSDISEKTALQEQALQHRKMESLSQLAGGMAHDFNNILNGIMSAVELLQIHDKRLNDTNNKYLGIISQAIQRAANLTGKLFAFSRTESISKTTINLDQILDDVVDILSSTLNKNIKITLSKQAGNHIIEGNSSSLENAFLNLGINSSHAMDKGGSLQISTENIKLNKVYCNSSAFDIKPGEYCKITVSDTGTGIREESLLKVFEPFFTTNEECKGSGLGLSGVYGLVQDHDGEIKVSSIYGQGTTFNIILPISKVTSKNKSDNDIQSGIGTILLVDDEDINRVLGKEILESLGYKVFLAENGQESVEIFKEIHSEIDLVVMDMIMPVMNGSQAFLKMKEIDYNSRVIIASGYTKDESINELLDLGLSGFISKPYRVSELSNLIKNILKT